LKEYANRRSAGEAAEIPLWLVEAFSTQLARKLNLGILLNPITPKETWDNQQPYQSRLVGDPLEKAREHLANYLPMRFEQFNLGYDVFLSKAEWEHVGHCSQLMLLRLLELPGGKPAMRGFLQELPNFLNWQLAFLKSYGAHFETPLDVEKWWSLQLVTFVEKDGRFRLTLLSAIQKLDQIVASPIQLEPQLPGGPPPPAYPLQVMLDLAEYPIQREAVGQILFHLNQLQQQAPEELSKLIQDYINTLGAYLVRRDEASASNLSKGVSRSQKDRMIIRDTLNELTILDIIRSDIKNTASTPGQPSRVENSNSTSGL